jgi:hypothetical protein
LHRLAGALSGRIRVFRFPGGFFTIALSRQRNTTQVNERQQNMNAPSPPPEESEGPPRRRCSTPGTGKRFGASLFVRATPDEKRRIEARARAANLSVSRYLVRCALAQGRPPPTRQERAHLETLLFAFKRTALSLRRLGSSANAPGLRRLGAEPSLAGELAEVAALLESLARELARRIGGGGAG